LQQLNFIIDKIIVIDYFFTVCANKMMVVVLLPRADRQFIPRTAVSKIEFIHQPYIYKYIKGTIDRGQSYAGMGAMYPDIYIFCAEVLIG